MKRLLSVLTWLLPMVLCAQKAPAGAYDTAARVVDTYLALLNTDDLPSDSLLVMTTTVTQHGTTDTTYMRRWFTASGMARVEVEHNDYLQMAIYTNGTDRWRRFNPHTGLWEELDADRFRHHLQGYDFHSPLRQWREKGAKLTWSGTTLLNNQSLQVVKVEMPDMLDRYYMFDPANGLLTIIIENSPVSTESYQRGNPGHIDWKVYHEYLPVGTSLVSSLESFMRDGTLTILRTEAHLAPMNTDIFSRD